MKNGLNREGAERLCENIRRYWRARGFFVSAYAVVMPGAVGCYAVRSNLVNGLPREIPLQRAGELNQANLHARFFKGGERVHV